MPSVDESVVRYGVVVSGLTRDREQDHAFVLSIFRSASKAGEFVTDRHLRYSGALIDKPRLNLLGLRGNVKVSSEFFDILNMAGRADPVNAAGVIVRCVNNALHTLRDLEQMQKFCGEDCDAILLPSNAAYGPCDQAVAFANRCFAARAAPILPLRHCTWPGQCACKYRTAHP